MEGGMRQIAVSTDVYARLWAERRSGEDTEDDILRRVLNVTAPAQRAAEARPAAKVVGFRDPRFGLELPEGFEIFRTFKGKEYRAKAVAGSWMLMDTGDLYPSLHKLGRAIGAKIENAWNNWYYLDGSVRRRLVDTLRRKP